MTYPSEFDDYSSFVYFEAYKYIPTVENEPSQSGEGSNIKNKKYDLSLLDDITLYFPNESQSTQTLSWNEKEGGMLMRMLKRGGVVADAFKKSTLSDHSALTNALKDQGLEAAKDIFFGGYLLDKLGKSEGQIQNPLKDMFFGGVNFREHEFSFDFSPVNQSEANEVRNIIRAFKKNSLPSSVNGSMMPYPPTWKITAVRGGQEVQQYKKCAITSINTNYSPDQVIANLEDGSPAHIKLTLSFKEIELVAGNDYDSLPDNSYGY